MKKPLPICLLPGLLRRAAACERGIALTEFAFALPIFLVLVLGGLETANLAMTHMRVNQIAITVADNAGRVRTGIDESNVYEFFSGAALIGDPLDFNTKGRIVISSLEPNGRSGSEAGQMINWQRCYGGLDVDPAYGLEGAGRTDASLAEGMGREGNRIQSADGTAVMFAEVTYLYTPLFMGQLIDGERMIRYESAFNVRERTNQNITNIQSLAVNRC